ncbi:MAG: DMT family transporter [Alphaproteobacteria bacterium]|jgi:drug/metabolite transporter (DMT)-like permease
MARLKGGGMAGQTKGILCILGGGAIFSFTDAVSKVMMDDYPVGEVIFFRSFFVLLFTIGAIFFQGGWAEVRIVDWRRQAARGVNIALTGMCFMFALKRIPLADMTAMVFLGPLILTALAPYFLGERVGWRRWTAVVIGFCGVLFIVDPSGGGPLWPLLLAACVPFLTSTRDILTRKLGKTDSANAVVLISTTCTVISGALLLSLGWVTPDWYGMGLFALTGFLQGVAQFLTVYAFVYGEAVVVTPFRYFMLIWATMYGYLFFAHIPRMETFIGAAIVSASGLYIFYRETKVKRR